MQPQHKPSFAQRVKRALLRQRIAKEESVSVPLFDPPRRHKGGAAASGAGLVAGAGSMPEQRTTETQTDEEQPLPTPPETQAILDELSAEADAQTAAGNDGDLDDDSIVSGGGGAGGAEQDERRIRRILQSTQRALTDLPSLVVGTTLNCDRCNADGADKLQACGHVLCAACDVMATGSGCPVCK